MLGQLLYESCRKVWMKSYFHTERTFCYELYHQMRNYLENEENNNLINQNNLNNIVISAEITKNLNLLQIPDMVFHNDTSYDNNDDTKQFLVMEVKNITYSNRDIASDLKKLYYYMAENLNYENAVLILFSKTPYVREDTFFRRVNTILDLPFEDGNITFKNKFNTLLEDNGHDKKLFFTMVFGQDNNQTDNVILLEYTSDNDLNNFLA